MCDIKHIIVQAGGLGTRMGNLTLAKPKTLIPINGKPILFHLMDVYSDANFYVICDYMADILVKYTKKFRPSVNVSFVMTKGKGTCAGIREALTNIPDDEPFILTWSDLVFLTKQSLPMPIDKQILIGTTHQQCSFPCRWKATKNLLIEEDNLENGVSGFFLLKNKKTLEYISENGSFTDHINSIKHKINWDTFSISNVFDVGTYASFEKLQKNNRYFNEVTINETTVNKKAIVKEYEKLIHDEIDWYKFAKEHSYDRIPKVLSENPYILSRIQGVNPFLKEPNEEFFRDIIEQISTLHHLANKPIDTQETEEVYIKKTLQRVYSVKDLIPFFNDSEIIINGNIRKNPFHNTVIESFLEEIKNVLVNTCREFCFIHGDCTFSNIISFDNRCYFIDPRGYFGKKKYYGDPRYDWAKLYYSFYGNYDNINSKNYVVKTVGNQVFFHIDQNGWETYSDNYFKSIPYTKKEIDLLHVLIWFSLSGYVIEDYSSIIISFYKGVELWNEYQKEHYPHETQIA